MGSVYLPSAWIAKYPESAWHCSTNTSCGRLSRDLLTSLGTVGSRPLGQERSEQS
jgi:hypothetical protein